MDTELYIHPKVTNNNSTKKKWSTSSNPALERLEENTEIDENNGSSGVLNNLGSSGNVTGRRKSWHVGKLDYRKRRKASESVPKYDRQKRHSWWNVFIPDHFNRLVKYFVFS